MPTMQWTFNYVNNTGFLGQLYFTYGSVWSKNQSTRWKYSFNGHRCSWRAYRTTDYWLILNSTPILTTL